MSGQKFSRGQSLIETLVAITVMVIGVFGAVYLGVFTIRAAQTSQLDVVAENLAREGIESVRWIRDFNWRQAIDWDTGLADGQCYRLEIGNDGAPENGYPTLTKIDCPGTSGSPDYRLCLDTNLGQYFHDALGGDCTKIGKSVEPSAFLRSITVERIDDYLQVTCLVTRDGGLGSVDYSVVENLYNWKQ